jgi:hypothetical protein
MVLTTMLDGRAATKADLLSVESTLIVKLTDTEFFSHWDNDVEPCFEYRPSGHAVHEVPLRYEFCGQEQVLLATRDPLGQAQLPLKSN